MQHPHPAAITLLAASLDFCIFTGFHLLQREQRQPGTCGRAESTEHPQPHPLKDEALPSPHPRCQSSGNFDSSSLCHEKRQDHKILHVPAWERLNKQMSAATVSEGRGSRRRGAESRTGALVSLSAPDTKPRGRRILFWISSGRICSLRLKSCEVGNAHGLFLSAEFPNEIFLHLASGKAKQSPITPTNLQRRGRK